jgi:hypothetical protein
MKLEKISTHFGILRILEKKLNICLTKFKNNQILLNKISRQFLATTSYSLVMTPVSAIFPFGSDCSLS